MFYILELVFCCFRSVIVDNHEFVISLLQEHAFESSQKYKEGKFIIELAHMIKDNGWED